MALKTMHKKKNKGIIKKVGYNGKKYIPLIQKILFQTLIFAFFVLTFSLFWARDNYGNIDFEEIVFHLNVPLQGVSTDFLKSYFQDALKPASIYWLVELLWVYWPAHSFFQISLKRGQKEQKIRIFPLRISKGLILYGLLIWFGLLFVEADRSFEFGAYLKNQFTKSKLIEEEYVDPRSVELIFPEKKKNLISIFIESGETSAQDRINGGLMNVNYIPELTEIAKNNVSFSHSDLIEGSAVAPGCNWTVAALVAETAGVPLKVYSADVNGTNNKMSMYQYFTPGAYSLGEILEREGYKNIFMAGSDFRYGGRANYFLQHGNYEIWDHLTARSEGKIPKDYSVWWGFEDCKLFNFAEEKLLQLAENDQPFNFSLLTVDTHHQDGYVCELCRDEYNEQYANVWACASRQIDGFIKWIQEQDFYEDTVIYISGDHCSMDSDFYGSNTKDDYLGQVKRKVYNAFINSSVEPVQEKNRRFTTLDMYPTILRSMGVEIKGERLGLGTNLFSEEKTLAEKYGYPVLFEELSKKSDFYDKEILYPKK